MRLETLEGRQLLATFMVTNVSDSGAGSLRQAILDVNSASGASSIDFNIPGTGVQTIAPTSPLPAVTNPVIIDATTQPGYAGTPLVELNGANIFRPGVTPPTPLPNVDGLLLSGGSSMVKGLAINRFTGNGIHLTRDGNTISADYIGTDPTGTQALGNKADGILVFSRNNVIGGPGAGDRNVISGNAGDGIFLGASSAQPSGNVIERNLIGTDVSGTLDLGNVGAGIDVESSSNVIGGTLPTTQNIIAFNGGAGVQVGSNRFVTNVVQDRISGNSIFSNVGLGIDLGGDGVTFNTPGGANFGPNNLQNYPIVSSAYTAPGGITVEGSLNATPNSQFTVEFFANTQPDRSGFGQGRTPIGTRTFMTDATGNVDITSTLAATVPPGQFISATATDGSGNTSEFAQSRLVTATAQSDLAVTAFNPNPTAQAGVAQTYAFSVQNLGPSKATNVKFVDTLPAGATFLSGSSSQGMLLPPSGGVVNVNVGDLASGASATIFLTFSIPTAGLATNVASVSSDQLDPSPGNNQISQNFQVLPAAPVDLSIFGEASPFPVQVGDQLTYTFIVGNNGGSPASGVVVTDPLPANVAFDSAQSSQGGVIIANGVVTANLGNLPGFSNATVTVVVRPLVSGSLLNTARVSGNELDPNAINNSTTVQTFVNPAPAIDVAVSIQAAPQPAMVGHVFTYAVLVGNPGTTTATGVTLTDLLPDAVSIASIKPAQGTVSQSGNVLTANLGSLAAGAVTEVTITLTPGAPGAIVNQASVTADQPEFNIANNFDTNTTTVVADVAAPIVVAQKLTTSGQKITSVILTFSQALDPTSASDINNYQVLNLGSNGSLSASGPSVAIARAVYNPVTRSVTLSFRQSLSVGRFYKVIANGPGAPGLVDLSGNVLNGEVNGNQNSIYQSLIGRGTKTRPLALQVGVTKPKPVHHASAKAHHK
jgi:uncharacterized repeat protein (TIGR01451 family)